jgi:hypothetical protein
MQVRFADRLSDDTVSQMGYAIPHNHAELFKINRRHTEILKQAHTRAEQNGRNIKLHFVQQTGFDTLLGDVRAGDGDILAPGELPRLENGAFHAIGDEGEG